MKVLIIGGVAAGTKVAAKLKREDRSLDVTILTKDNDISYAGCGLPYYVGNVIREKEQLIVNTPEKFEKLTGVNVLTEMEVIKVNPKEKAVGVLNLQSNERYDYGYDKLVIASGASPIKPPVEGLDLKGVFFMRTPEDAIRLRKSIEKNEIKRAVVVGAGFIGLEVAENMAKQGVKVSVIDMAEHVLPGFDEEMSEYIENHLAENGIMTATGVKMEGIVGTDRVEKVKTSRRAMKADAVVLSIGIRANTSFLQDSGVELMPNKTIKVNEYLQTNIEDVYAIGDCACVVNKITKSPQWSPMGSSANIEGRLTAKNILGKNKSYEGVLGTAVCKLPNLNTGRTGLTEVAAKETGYNPISVISVVDDKAHYYPGAGSFIVKMIADKDTKKLLGLQVLGSGDVDKMIDIAVTAISLNASIDDLENLDFAYAPPFSTAIHPFAHTLNILQNKMNKEFDTITPLEFKEGKAKDYKIIDASISPTLKAAPYIDLTKVEGVLPEYDIDEKLLLICAKGKRAYMLQNRLKFYGYNNTKVLEGGLTFNEIDEEEE
ncbi:FAD-dependent oxidoreductase [Terrisporobacter mayombei]|uniref:Coenzyme A disulfide reductase n=1 Tax=Terrisporobacter mayombei TaxID=1541 RepID=A0ABY9Q6A6_9FIRM|nr:FAD-dependent oxidoreductase [Terrisporobacter mayombei]MCC3868786.1 FAD-dependent oxidoreductase [Terrisporobacter mayombei]WMT83086.1 Coenzyme A disulfide reductase [Terrisporobacter mayombei]